MGMYVCHGNHLLKILSRIKATIRKTTIHSNFWGSKIQEDLQGAVAANITFQKLSCLVHLPSPSLLNHTLYRLNSHQYTNFDDCDP